MMRYLVFCDPVLMGVFFITMTFAFLRFVVPVSGKLNKRDVYKNLAHIWVGILLGIAIASTGVAFNAAGWPTFDFNGWYWGLAIGLTAVEVVAFIVRRAPSSKGGAA